jgi:hypothetical protein
MGLPISGLIAEIFLQIYEQKLIQDTLDSKKLSFTIDM